MTEQNYGFIHDELEIKILILFILHRLPFDIEPDALFDICASDNGVGYFDYSSCLEDLVAKGNVEETEIGYKITAKGALVADSIELSLPYSVRINVEQLIEPVAERLGRAAMIRAEHSSDESSCMVQLSLSDGISNIIELKLLCDTEENARRIKKNFRRDAEGYYQRIVEILSEDKN